MLIQSIMDITPLYSKSARLMKREVYIMISTGYRRDVKRGTFSGANIKGHKKCKNI